MSRRGSLKILLLLMTVSFALHLVPIRTGAIPFYYDTARDAFTIQSLLRGDIKFQGPPSSTPGLFHGVAYYYLLAPWYLLGGGDPRLAVVGLAVFLSLAIPVSFCLGLVIFKKSLPSFLLALIVAFSPQLAQYSTWLSNPSPALVTIPLYYVSLLLMLRGRALAALLAAFALGLSIHWEIFLSFHLVALVPLLFSSARRHLPLFFFTLGLVLSPMLAVQLKNFSSTKSAVAGLLSGSDATVAHQTIGYIFSRAAQLLSQELRSGLHPSLPLTLGVPVILVGLYVLFRRHRVSALIGATWLITFVIGLKFGGSATPFLAIGLGPLLVLLALSAVSRVYALPRLRLPALALCLFSAFSLGITTYLHTSSVYADLLLQPDLQLAHELPALDYMYAHADKFSINSIGAPLYVNTTWSYLFNWYGKKTYGRVPYFHGHDQVGQLGNNLSAPPPDIATYYLVIDPPDINLARWLPEARGYEDSRSSFVSAASFGQISVETRKPLSKGRVK